MRKVFAFVFALALCFVGVSRGAIVNDLAGPSDYGGTVQPSTYDLATLTVGDTRQGFVNDCWWCATVAGILHQRPTYLSRNYQVQANGTVNVTYYKSGNPVTYNVTADINPWWGNPYTGYDDSNGNAAAAIMLKAYADYRDPSNTMADMNYGLPTEALSAFGLQSGFLPNSISSIIAAFQKGDIVVVDTGFTVPAGVVDDHSYDVWSVDAAAGTVVLRSPWGDGYEPGDHEFLTVNQQWLSAYNVVTCYGQFGGAVPAPEPASLATLGVGAVVLVRRRRK